MNVPQRRLGRSRLVVSAVGMGCNTIGGPSWDRSVREDLPAGYGEVDDAESIRAVRRAVELGINFFDTADEYGCGHSERILGQALGQHRLEVIISTKFGYTFDESTKELTGTNASPIYIRSACENSLRRLGTDYIDLYLFHLRDYPVEQAGEVRETLEELVKEGKICWYGWSTDDSARARFFAQGEHCAVIEHRLNVLIDAPRMLSLCDELDLGSINRIPLLMGVLSGKFSPDRLPPEDDIRSLYFRTSGFASDLEKLERLRSVLTSGGRSLAQGCLAWILARHPGAVPIPGFRSAWQVEQNALVLAQGPLDQESMRLVESLLCRA